MAGLSNLTAADFHQILDGLRDLYAYSDLEESPKRFMRVARRLVPGDFAAYEELNQALGRTIGANDPPEARPAPQVLEVFAQLAAQGGHPIISHWMRHPRHRHQAVSISQLRSRAEYHNSAIYHDVYKDAEAEDQLGLQLACGGPVMVAMAITRSRRGFSDRDHLVLQILQPHLAQAYANAAAVSRLRAQAEASCEMLQISGAGVVRVDMRGMIAAISPSARQWFCEYCGKWKNVSRLPPCVAKWLGQQQERSGELHVPRDLELEGLRGRLIIRLAWERAGVGSLLVLEERIKQTAVAAHMGAGMSPRQRQVLEFLLVGDGEKQIAAKLGISKNTVHNYVTALYRHFDVSSRSELMAIFIARDNSKARADI